MKLFSPTYLLQYFITLICVVHSLSNDCPQLENGRLSTNVRPHHYDLVIRLDLNSLALNGTAAIYVEVKSSTNIITVHGRALNVISAKFTNDDGEFEAETNYCKDEETINFNFKTLIKGNGKLEIIYSGNLSTERVDGIYALQYFNGNEVRYSVATHFESTNARTAFPCFDEPNLKATFSISIIAPKDRTILSTMPAVQNVSVSETETKVVFAKSPKMSTYMPCIVVGDFDFLEQQSKDGKVVVRVYTPVGRSEQGSFALEVAIKALDFLQNYVGIEYSLPKLDMVAVKDMAPNAMENWGLIVYKELRMLVDENSPISTRQRIALLVCHEIIHQWFGNLVTLDWWTHTWVNEAFANFFESFIVNELFKEWNQWSMYLSEGYSTSMQVDSLHSSHPIELNETKYKEIDDIAFDTIVYVKGGAILRMLREWIGDEEFRKGLTKYLLSKQYGNAVTDDVLMALNNVSSKPVKEVMNTWFKQKGYPMLNFSSEYLFQEKFSMDGKNSNEDKKMLWNIPVIYSVNNSSNETLLMRRRMDKLPSNFVLNWNVGSYGFYRTLYSKQDYDKLFTDMNSGKINAEQRFSIQNDLFEFAKAGIVSTVDYLEYLKQYTNEDQYFVWNSIGKSLSEISLMLSNTDCSQKMNAYTRSLLANLQEKINRSSDNSDLTTLLRVFAYRRLGSTGDSNIVRNAIERFYDYYNETVQLNRDFRSAVIAIAAANANDYIYNALFDLFKRNTNDATQRDELANAMGSSGNGEYLRRALNFSLSKRDVTNSESVVFIESIGRTSRGRDIAWNFFVQNYVTYKTRFEATVQATLLIKGIVSSFASMDKMNEIEEFFTRNEFKGIESTLKMSLETIRNRVLWFNRDSSKVCDYLNNEKY